MPWESDLSAYILADPAIVALIGTRMYPLVLPQGVTYPAVSYYLVSVTELRDLSGPIGEEQARITFNAWAETYLQAKQGRSGDKRVGQWPESDDRGHVLLVCTKRN